MKKNQIALVLLTVMMVLLLPVISAQAKEIPEDGNIPLTAEYFPDKQFLKYPVRSYDKDKNGYLSPEEIAEVTMLNCRKDLHDFTPVQYFTNLRELELDSYGDKDNPEGVWVGTEIDLTVFPNLEKVRISLDTEKAPDGSPKVRIRASGLKHLKSMEVEDQNENVKDIRDGRKTKIDVVDLRDTPALEYARLFDAKGVIFDEKNRIKELWLDNIQEIPVMQIEKFTEMEYLHMCEDSPDFTSLDLSGNHVLRKLWIYCDYLKAVVPGSTDQLEYLNVRSGELGNISLSENPNLKELELNCPKLAVLDVSGNPKLESLSVTSAEVKGADVSGNKNLKSLFLKCPALDALTLAGADRLEWVRIDGSALETIELSENQCLKEFSLVSSRLGALDVSRNPGLESLGVGSDRLKTIDLTKNPGLKSLDIGSAIMKKLDLKKNRKLEFLRVHCEHMRVLDLSANTALTRFYIDATPLKVLDLSANVNLKEVSIENTSYREISLPEQKKLEWLFLKGNRKLEKVDLKNNRRLVWLIINGSKKLTKLDLTKNKKLDHIDVRDNALKTLKLGKQKYVRFLYCQHNNLKVLDLTDVRGGLYDVWCDKGVKVKGYQGYVKRF